MLILAKRIMNKLSTLSVIVLVVIFITISFNASLAQSSIEFLNIEVEDIDGETVKIKWNTNIATQGKIIYGKSSDSLGNYLIDNKGYSKFHEMEIGNLGSETTYYFQIIATSIDERVYSFIQNFKTEEYHDDIPPQISNLEIPYKSGTAVVITWETDEEGTSVVEFDQHKTYKIIARSNKRVTDHQIILKNLSPNIDYFLRAYSIDKDNNKSNYYIKEFTTYSTDQSEEDLVVSHLRPGSSGDSNITDTSVTVSFETNHWANGYVKLGRNSKNIDYELNHQVTFYGLLPETEYVLYIRMTDIFNKRVEVKDIIIKTAKTQPIEIGPSNENLLDISCSNQVLALNGYYGQYFNLPSNLASIKQDTPDNIGEATGWYDNKYLSFSRVDSDLGFGDAFFPLDEGFEGDPYYFSVYWRAIIDVPVDGIYNYQIKSDDDSWVYVDNNLTTDLRGIHKVAGKSQDIALAKGLHSIEIYFAERRQYHSYFSFDIDGQIKIYPWPTDCSFLLGQTNGNGGISNGNGNGNGDSNGTVVKGVEFSYYTKATALYKTTDSPDVYAIVNGQRHYISSPTSFREYGYDWNDIRTVSREELAKYPRARLIKSPESPTIYYLYQRPESQWLKITIPSPTAFVSYPGNFWGNVITVTQLDIDSYPNVKIIKTTNDTTVYYLDNNVKYFVSEEVFKNRNFRTPEIVEVSQVHLDTYMTGSPLN